MSYCCCHWPDVLRWCTLSTIEQRKCTDMRDAFQTRGLVPRIECVFGESVKNCMQRIKVATFTSDQRFQVDAEFYFFISNYCQCMITVSGCDWLRCYNSHWLLY